MIHSFRPIAAQGEQIREHFPTEDLSIRRESAPDLGLRDVKGENIRGQVFGSEFDDRFSELRRGALDLTFRHLVAIQAGEVLRVADRSTQIRPSFEPRDVHV